MSVIFLDSSAVMKRYVAETGSSWTINIFKPSSNKIIYIAQITGVEVVSAISRRQLGRNLTANAANKAITRFTRDFQNKLRILRLTDSVTSDAMLLAETHGLRGYDAVQLATAIELEKRFVAKKMSSITFISADNQLNQSAQNEGLKVDNPNNH